MTNASRSDQRGSSLIEVMIACSLLSMLMLGVAGMFFAELRHMETCKVSYEALTALRSFLADAQGIANADEDLANQQGIGAVYNRFHGKTLPAPNFPEGRITIKCFADEATVPGELGGPQDLNFDGDSEDNLGGQTNGYDLRLVPMMCLLTYRARNQTLSIPGYRLVSKTND